MYKQEKVEKVETLKKAFERAQAVLFVDYKGVTSNEMNSLRADLREQDMDFCIVKNNLVQKALKGSPKEAFAENLAGPTAALFSYGDMAAAAKTLKRFSEDVEALSLKEGLLGDKPISVEEIKQLADLPSKEVLVAQLLGVLSGPLRNLCGVLNAVQRDFVYVLKAIVDKKESGK